VTKRSGLSSIATRTVLSFFCITAVPCRRQGIKPTKREGALMGRLKEKYLNNEEYEEAMESYETQGEEVDDEQVQHRG